MRSAIVPSSSSACADVASSFSTSGGDGAMCPGWLRAPPRYSEVQARDGLRRKLVRLEINL
eukprot:6031188-Pleurochrysis_carterae.AAC.2